MTLKEAIETAQAARGSAVSFALDCGDRWAFGFKDDEGCLGSAPAFVFKNDGRCEFFFIGDFLDLLRAGNPIPIKEDT